MGRISSRWVAVAIALGVVALVGFNVWTAVRHRYADEFMDATWTANPAGAAGSVAGRVTGWDGRPEVGQRVEADRAGGAVGALMTITDADGRFVIPGAGDVTELAIVGVDSIPLSHWNLPGHGVAVTFDVRLKRPPPPSRGPL